MLSHHVRALAGAGFCAFAGAAMAGPAPNGVQRPMQAHVHRGFVPAALPDSRARLPPRALWRAYSGTPIDVTTYHYDALRTGWNPSETDLTPATVQSGGFQQLATLNVDGNVLAQPLLLSGYQFPDGSTHDVLIVATGHNSVYAFDAQSYALLWQVNLGPSQSSSDVGCGDVVPEYGISSTPLILRSAPGAATLYVVSALEPASFSFHTYLHALDVGTGQDLQSPVEIAPSARAHGGTVSFQPQSQWNRTGIAYGNNALYIGIGSHCDQTNASGWLLQYDPSLHLQATFHTESPSDLDLGSVWMTGFAPAINASGNIFVVTGNGNFQKVQGARSLAMSALSLGPGLARVNSSFTPADWQNLSNNDQDFGSGGIMLLPPLSSGPAVAVTIGKWGTLYLLNQNRLGGLTTGDTGPLDQIGIGGGVWGGPGYYGSPNGPLVFVQGDGGVLNSFSVSAGNHPRFAPVAQGTSNGGYGGALMAISSNGSAAGTGVVWLARRGATVQLEAYDAMALGNPIFAANAGVWSNTSYGNSFVTPMEANGRVYVPAYQTVTVFGLAN